MESSQRPEKILSLTNSGFFEDLKYTLRVFGVGISVLLYDTSLVFSVFDIKFLKYRVERGNINVLQKCKESTHEKFLRYRPKI